VPELLGVSHVSLTVRDLERSERWYADVLGLRRVLLVEEPGHDFVVLLHPSTGTMIGLHTHVANHGERAHEVRTGLDHVGFAVASRADLDAWAAVLEAKGVEHSPVVDASYGHGLSFRDPDNIPLELFCLRAPA
jgi:glyoxylase I family protein